MNKSEAAELLQISPRTLERRLQAGTYKCTRTGTGKYDPITFTHADLGLAEPTPKPVETIAPTPEPSPERKALHLKPVVVPESNIDAKEANDQTFAAAYLAGDACDSAGNTVDGVNQRFPSKGLQSLIGNPPVAEMHNPETQSHMNPALLGTHTSDGQKIEPTRHSFENGTGFTRRGVALAAGLSQEVYDAMMKSHDKRGGRPSMSQQAEAVWRAEENIRRAFPKP